MNLADLRKEYTLAGLRRTDLAQDPIVQFSRWLEAAIASGLPEPTALTVATVDRNGQPSARTVLLKAVDQRGFIFFTNYESRKGKDLATNARCALTLYWKELERQICVGGAAEKISREESEVYFKSRPPGSRRAAWVSPQTEIIAGRAALEDKLKLIQEKFPGDEIPLPPYWGGYVVVPATVEFWQGRPNRLHDRFLYTRQQDGSWRIDRLAP